MPQRAEYWEKPKQQQRRFVNALRQTEKRKRTEGSEQGKHKLAMSHFLKKN